VSKSDPKTVTAPKPSAKRRRGSRLALEIALVALLILGIRAWQQRDLVTGPAPELAGVGLDGKPVSLLSLRGRPVLVHFWATWCPVCRAEQGSIDALAREYPTVTVAMQSGNAQAVGRHLQNEALRFPVINDPDGVIAGQWGVRAVPASFVVDADGQIRFVEIGYTTGIGLRLRLWLAGL
jgi:thiol-disulfide isomerase/thioredoxin